MRNGQRRREEIQRRAIEVFARKGFGQSSLQDVAQELGITREAIYYYFGNKKEILLPAILEPSRQMLARARAILASPASPAEKLRAALRSHLEHFSPTYLEASVALREKSLLQDPDFAELRRLWKRYETCWLDLVVEGQRAGVFRSSLDPRAVTYAILGMCNWLSRWYRPDGEIGVDALVDNFFRLCAHGLLVKRRKSK